MAFETTTTPTRRLALQDLSVNVVLKAPPGITRPLGAKSSHPSKPAKLAEEPRADESRTSAERSPVRAEARLGSQKRVFGLVQGGVRGVPAEGLEDVCRAEGDETARKRVKTVGEVAVDDDQPDQRDRYENPDFHLSSYEEYTCSSGLSPGSSFGNSPHGLNDTQSTVVTEPDHSRAGAMTRAELRQKARALKLRLSLAKYKVQTNQIDTPMSQLQIKSTTESLKLPSVSRLPNTLQNRPLSSASRHSDTQTVPSKWPHPENARSFSSSPPPYIESASHDESRDESRATVSTPLLPRQGQSLLYPPLLGGDSEDRSPVRELTSSVVKGRAAKGLLSLMGHGS